MIRLTYIFILIAFPVVLTSCDTPMSQYEPINGNEKEIIGMMNQFLEARNSNDVDMLATLFDHDGEYIAGDGTTLKGRDGIASSDPVWWTQYGKQKLFNLKLHIEESEATVSTTGKWGFGHRRPQTFYLVKNDGKWLISKVALDR